MFTKRMLFTLTCGVCLLNGGCFLHSGFPAVQGWFTQLPEAEACLSQGYKFKSRLGRLASCCSLTLQEKA